MSLLADHVAVSRRYQRSLRLDTDLGEADALQGFVCHPSAVQVLLSMTEQFTQSSQRAFTWTGPFGGGKSSLALALAALLGPAGPLRSAAEQALGATCSQQILAALRPSEQGWLAVPVVGRRTAPAPVIGSALQHALQGSVRNASRKVLTSEAVVTALLEAAEARPQDGVLLLIDELGKFLDAAANEDADIHFFQDLAERAARSPGRLLIVGILHQPFEQYARRLGRETRDEWAKIQGRYADIPMVVAVDEVVDLVGRAIHTHEPQPRSTAIADAVAQAVQRRRPTSAPDLAQRLHRCWPLHPVTAALLGPMSRRRFGQNERSVFGFLTSAEPAGFQEFLRNTASDATAFYTPDRLWDYLRLNLEPAILASSDSHRWAQGVDAIERCEARGGALHVRLAKALALIDLFRSSAQLAADPVTLASCAPDAPATAVETAIADLETWSVAVFRKHLNAWAIFSGSDFEIEAAIAATSAQQVGLDLARLAKYAGLQPVLAKKHYYETGNMRWFQCFLGDAEDLTQLPPAHPDAAGRFVLLISREGAGSDSSLARCVLASEAVTKGALTVYGAPNASARLQELGRELLALASLSVNRPELAGDSVARREIAARLQAVSTEFALRVQHAFQDATWCLAGSVMPWPKGYTLSRLASELADRSFAEAPHIHSELVNRQRPSSNTQAGVRELLHAMIAGQAKPALGIEGYPIERGLYATVLERAGIHRAGEGGQVQFMAPDQEPIGRTYQPLWKAAESLLSNQTTPLTVAELYACWAAPPLGVRRGVMPLLALAFALANAPRIAIYCDGQFQAEIDGYFADLLLQDPHQVGFRWIAVDAPQARQLAAIADALDLAPDGPAGSPLAIARTLVRLVRELPQWTRKTLRLSPKALALRRIVLQADDPHQLLFVDLPGLLPSAEGDTCSKALREILAELTTAYGRMLASLSAQLFAALQHPDAEHFVELRARAASIQHRSGDLRIDAFAARLAHYDGGLHEMEAIASLAISRPPREWTDRDVDEAGLALNEFALRFCRAETLVRVTGRDAKREAMALIIGSGGPGRAVVREFEVHDRDRARIDALARALTEYLSTQTQDRNLIFAALAQAGLLAEDLQAVGPLSAPR